MSASIEKMIAVLDEFPDVQKYWRHKAAEKIALLMQKAKDTLLTAELDKIK